MPWSAANLAAHERFELLVTHEWQDSPVEPHDTMQRLSRRLGVVNEPQDWGIINGSSDRFDEFLRLYEADGLNTIERSAMAGLVLASANERLVEVPTVSLKQLVVFLPRIATDASWELDYWRGLDPSSFPLSGWLQQHR